MERQRFMAMLVGGLSGLFMALVTLVVLLVAGLSLYPGAASSYDLWFFLTPLVFFSSIGIGLAVGYRVGRPRPGGS